MDACERGGRTPPRAPEGARACFHDKLALSSFQPAGKSRNGSGAVAGPARAPGISIRERAQGLPDVEFPAGSPRTGERRARRTPDDRHAGVPEPGDAVKVLVTGSAGFIGSHVAMRLLDRGDEVVGVDNLSDYYDVSLKRARLAQFGSRPRCIHVTADLADRGAMESIFAEHRPQRVVHLAAQAGVRYAAENPHVYVSSNVTGFLHVLEGCRHHGVEHLVFASTSSVYGANGAMPFSEHQPAEHPLTLYAATKKANESMAHAYANLFGLACTGLRFFTVYGPWGRPDMALFLFTRAMLAGQPIRLFNHGRHRRSFTYIDDIVDGVVGVLDRPPTGRADWNPLAPDPATSRAPYRLYNIGSGESVELTRYVEVLERCLGLKAQVDSLPLQPGDVPDSHADCSDLEEALGARPRTPIEVGVPRFIEWYRHYHG